MKKVKASPADGDMLPKYDFSGAVRGKYYERFPKSMRRTRPGRGAFVRYRLAF